MRAIAGSRTSLDAGGLQAPRDDRMSGVLCERGTVLTTPPGVTALACPILGGAGVMTGEWSVQLGKADIWVGDAQTRHDIIVSPRGACIVLAGTPAAWSSLCRGGAGARWSVALFPAIHRFVPALGRRLLRLVRHCLCGAQLPGDNQIAHQLASLVDDLQRSGRPTRRGRTGAVRRGRGHRHLRRHAHTGLPRP